MGKPDELTAKERRQFEDLIRTYHEFEAFDPHCGDAPPHPEAPPRPDAPALAPSRGRRLWTRWRRRR